MNKSNDDRLTLEQTTALFQLAVSIRKDVEWYKNGDEDNSEEAMKAYSSTADFLLTCLNDYINEGRSDQDSSASGS
jgi:hypothetical protein